MEVHPSICKIPFDHNTDYSFCPVAVKLHMPIMSERIQVKLNHEVVGEGKVKVNCCPHCEEMPCSSAESWITILLNFEEKKLICCM